MLAIIGMGPGVSAAVARRFGREGFVAAAIARRPDALQEEVAALALAGITAGGFGAEAADPASLRDALARAAPRT